MVNKLHMAVNALFKSDKGATAVEYGVIVALIVFAMLLVVSALGIKISEIYKSVYQSISTGNQVQP